MAKPAEHDPEHTAPALPLPSGQRITLPREELPDGSTGGDPELWRCGGCECPFVQPIEWDLVGRTHWRVTLRCPNCEWVGTGVFSQEAVDRFDRELDRGMRKLQGTLSRVTRACMEADIEHFARALDADLIVPFDF
jgi:hypothetical protein